MSNNLRKQLIGYIISGILATGSDYIVYNLIIHFYTNYVISKTISFLVGTIIAFFYNKYITFNVKAKSRDEIWKFFVLYIISMVLNVSINRFGIMLFEHYISIRFAIDTAFLIATFVSVVINFTGQKFWVFKSYD